MVKRTYRLVTRVVGAAVLAATALVVVAALRLLEGPVDLGFLKDRVAAAADVPGNDLRPQAERILLEWPSLRQPMKLVFTGVSFVDREDKVVARAPSIALTFDARSVFQGMLLPTSITIEGPSIEANIQREGGMLRRVFADTGAQSQGEAVALLVEQLFAEPNDKSLMGRLNTVLIEHAKLTLRDVKTGLTWTAPDARARLSRDKEGVSIAASARLTGEAGHGVDVNLSGGYTRDRSRVSLVAAVDGFRPSALADLSPDVELLRGVDLAMSGRLYIEANGHGDIRGIEIDITGGNGQITLPGVLPVTHKVRGMNARAVIDAASHTATIQRAEVEVGAARIAFFGAGEKKPEGQVFTGRVEVKQIPGDKLGEYWPLPFADGGREWALANISKGEIDIAADFSLSAPGNDIALTKVERLVGLIGYRGLMVRYMTHMPEMQGVEGTARYEGGTLHFDVVKGSAVGLRASGTTIDLTGLDKPPPQQAAIRMTVAGSAPDVIRFLARPRLGLPRDMLYDYRRLGGDVTVEVALGFPLVNTLAVSELDLTADATLSNFSLKDAIGQVGLSEATAKVRYVGSELAVSGSGKLDGTPAEIAWREMFGPKPPFRRRYELKGNIPAALVAKAGFPAVEPFLNGPIGTSLQYQVATNGTGEVTGKFDLKQAIVELPQIAWRKPAGVDGQAQATLKLATGGKLSTVEVEARAEGLAGKGNVRFTGDNVLQQVSLPQFRVGKTDVALDWKRTASGAEVSLRGPTVEMPRVREMIRTREAAAAKAPAASPAPPSSTRIDLKVQNVLSERGTLGYTNGRLDLLGDRIAFADLSIGAGKGSTFRVTPAPQGRKLFLYIADFGQMLSDAGWMDGLVNGYLHIEGQYAGDGPAAALDGFLKMGPFRLKKVEARPGIGTLNAAIDGLGRAGNPLQQFDSLEAKVTRQGDRVQIRNGRTSGQSIGLTAQGYIDLGNDTAKLSGVVVPAFALNNLLSNVPLLGPLLTGGKDGGLFAVSYQLSGPLDDLKTDVNIMSAVTPGALRELFNAPADAVQPPPSPEMQRAP